MANGFYTFWTTKPPLVMGIVSLFVSMIGFYGVGTYIRNNEIKDPNISETWNSVLKNWNKSTTFLNKNGSFSSSNEFFNSTNTTKSCFIVQSVLNLRESFASSLPKNLTFASSLKIKGNQTVNIFLTPLDGLNDFQEVNQSRYQKILSMCLTVYFPLSSSFNLPQVSTLECVEKAVDNFKFSQLLILSSGNTSLVEQEVDSTFMLTFSHKEEERLNPTLPLEERIRTYNRLMICAFTTLIAMLLLIVVFSITSSSKLKDENDENLNTPMLKN